MQLSENFDKSIGKETGRKVDPEQDLRDAIDRTEKEVGMYGRMDERYMQMRKEGSEGSVGHGEYLDLAGAGSRLERAEQNLIEYRKQLDELLEV